MRKPNATGGHFSVGYIAEHSDGRRGFLKAMDYTKAFADDDTPAALNRLTQGYMFERAMCEKCAHLSRIARAMESGSVGSNFNKVHYLIFELADRDIRAQLDVQDALDVAFVFSALHHVATGLEQLHRAGMAHQDLKPSNVLIFSGTAGSKICDLGRGWDRDFPGPHDRLPIAGDITYAPIDVLYGGVPTHHHYARRFGCDLYHLGSLIVFCFARTHINALVVDNMAFEHRPGIWGGDFAEVLPFVHAGFDLALTNFANETHQWCRLELRRFVAELCNPDPTRRGDPANRATNQYSLQRYISRFDRLAHLAKLELIRSV